MADTGVPAVNTSPTPISLSRGGHLHPEQYRPRSPEYPQPLQISDPSITLRVRDRCAPERMERPTTSTSSCMARVDNLFGRLPKPGIYHLKTGIPQTIGPPHGRLFHGPSSPGFCHQYANFFYPDPSNPPRPFRYVKSASVGNIQRLPMVLAFSMPNSQIVN